jgi:hypothetical protein
MQDDYTHDVAGSAGAPSASSPRWLRLTRSGDRVTGYESADGTRWTELGHADLTGLGTSATVGLFVASPGHEETSFQFGGVRSNGGPSLARAAFDDVGLGGGWSGSAWRGEQLGGEDNGPGVPSGPDPGVVQEPGGRFTVTGNGDIAPAVGGPTGGIERHLVGTFAALLAAMVVGAMFATSEYRRRLARLTFAATPGGGGCWRRRLSSWRVPRSWSAWWARRRRSGWATSWRGTARRPCRRRPGGAPRGRRDGGDAGPGRGARTGRRDSAAAQRHGRRAVDLAGGPAVHAGRRRDPADRCRRVAAAGDAGGGVRRPADPAGVPPGARGLRATPRVLPLPWWAGFGVLCAWTAGALALATVVVRRRDA